MPRIMWPFNVHSCTHSYQPCSAARIRHHDRVLLRWQADRSSSMNNRAVRPPLHRCLALQNTLSCRWSTPAWTLATWLSERRLRGQCALGTTLLWWLTSASPTPAERMTGSSKWYLNRKLGAISCLGRLAARKHAHNHTPQHSQKLLPRHL